MKHGWASIAAAAIALSMGAAPIAAAAELKLLTTGAMKEVVLAIVADFERQSGLKVIVANDTAGGVARRVESGEAFDVAVITPALLDDLTTKGKLAPGSRVDLAQVGIGVMVKAGAPAPDIGTVDAFKRALLAAKAVAYIDPASGGSSGIYLARLLERLGITEQIRPKLKLKQGGLVADLIVSGEAELGIHQISEIVPVQGVILVGPLPQEIQNLTVYAAGIGAGSQQPEAARALVTLLAGPAAAPVLKAKGMERPSR
jgi:molybdate transport system substrate-binding protein